MTEINGKVAHLLSDRELVFNVGSDAGVEVGSTAVVFDVVEVFDPDTAEPLGQVRRAVTMARIEVVEERMSIGRTFRTLRPAGYSPIDDLLSLRASKETTERVTTDPDEMSWNTKLVAIGQEAYFEPPDDDDDL